MGLFHKMFNNNQRKSKPKSKKSVLAPQPVFPKLQENILLKEALFHTDDLVTQKVSIPGHTLASFSFCTRCATRAKSVRKC